MEGTNLRTGCIRSCGCLNIEVLALRSTRHGHTRGHRFSLTYSSWASMMKRCYNPEEPGYANYGARGITVFEPWRLDFTAFLKDVGERPSPAHSLHRLDNSRGYEPGNVVWATRSTQARSTRVTHWVLYDGRRMSLAEAAELAGINYWTVQNRLRRGWSEEKALSLPAMYSPRWHK